MATTEYEYIAFMLTIAALLTKGEPLPFTETEKPLAPEIMRLSDELMKS